MLPNTATRCPTTHTKLFCQCLVKRGPFPQTLTSPDFTPLELLFTGSAQSQGYTTKPMSIRELEQARGKYLEKIFGTYREKYEQNLNYFNSHNNTNKYPNLLVFLCESKYPSNIRIWNILRT